MHRVSDQALLAAQRHAEKVRQHGRAIEQMGSHLKAQAITQGVALDRLRNHTQHLSWNPTRPDPSSDPSQDLTQLEQGRLPQADSNHQQKQQEQHQIWGESIESLGQFIQSQAQEIFQCVTAAQQSQENSTEAYSAAVRAHAEAVKAHVAANEIGLAIVKQSLKSSKART